MTSNKPVFINITSFEEDKDSSEGSIAAANQLIHPFAYFQKRVTSTIEVDM